MTAELEWNISQLKSRIDHSSNVVTTITLTVYGDIGALQGLLQRPLKIILSDMGVTDEQKD